MPAVAQQVRLTSAMAIAKAAMRRAQAGVTPITLTRLVRADRTATVLDCEIGDVLEIADQ